jgi:hypothetical protein
LGKIAARLFRMRQGAVGRFEGVKQPATLAHLYDRKKFGMVMVRTASLSQLRCSPGTGIAPKLRCLLPREGAGKAVRSDAERFA